MNNTMTSKTEHIVFLRAMATIAVVLYHSKPSVENGLVVHNFISLLFNWCVPIFFMISGALFFDSNKHVDFKYMLNKTLNILKIIVFWGFVYNLISMIIIEKSISLDIIKNSIFMILKADTTYCYQFWYLYSLIGIYLLIPLFKPWFDKYLKNGDNISNECVTMLIIWFLLSTVLVTCCNGFGISINVWNGSFRVFSAYFFLVICGRILENYDFNNKYKKFLILSLAIFVAQLLFFIIMIITGNYDKYEKWYGYQSIFTLNMSIVLYLLVKKIDFSKVNIKIRKLYSVVAKYSLQIYILHVMVIQILRKIGFTYDIINPWLYPVLNMTVTVSICVLIAYICKKIPIVKNLL